MDFFKYFEKLEKGIKLLYSYKLRGDECQGANKLVPSSGTYLCSMQGHMYRITTLGGKSPPSKNGESTCKGYVNGFAWIDMSQSWAIWLIIKVREASIRLNKARKNYDNAITI